MQDDQSLCPHCGAAATRRGPNAVVLAALGSILALGLIAGALSLVGRKTPDPGSIGKTTTTTTVATSTATATTTPTPLATASSASPSESPTDEETPFRLPIDHYAGDWVPRENVPSDQVLHLDGAGGGLLGTTETYTLNLMTATRGEDDLEGTLTMGSSPLALKANGSRDSSELRLTVVGENGETSEWIFERPYDTTHRQASPEDFKRAQAYLPAPYLVRILSARFPDDSTAVLTEKTGRIQKGIQLSELESSNGDELVFHYVNREDGVYRVPDDSPDQGVLWLPNDLEVGRKWNDGSYDCEVLAMEETVDLGFDKFPCLKVKRVNDAVDAFETAYYSPGYGEVLVQNALDQDTLRLTSFMRLKEGQGAGEILQKAPNAGKIPR